MANRRAALGTIASMALAPSATAQLAPTPALIRGVVWQPSEVSTTPRGTWQRLGARELLVQWSVVDGVAYLPGTRMRSARRIPDWAAVAREPWASDVIFGLAGRFDSDQARQQAAELARQSLEVTRAYKEAVRGPSGLGRLHVAAWYFPVEVDPTWGHVSELGQILLQLPRPLWISAYDNGNIGPVEFANWLAKWLPPNVGVFFQDGVGIHTREPYIAAQYHDAITARIGHQRSRLIAEAFRPQGRNRFGSAPVAELVAQLRAYRGRPVYLFEGPQYVPDAVVAQVIEQCAAAPRC
jgi:hypothetical protein